MTQVAYSGHHGTGGLQAHSIGPEYPHVIFGVGGEGPTKWAFINGFTHEEDPRRFDTYQQAYDALPTTPVANGVEVEYYEHRGNPLVSGYVQVGHPGTEWHLKIFKRNGVPYDAAFAIGRCTIPEKEDNLG